MEINIPDFDLEKTMNSGQIFRMYKNDDDSYTIYSADRRLEISPLQENVFGLSCSETEYEEYWVKYLDLATDYSAMYKNIDKNDAFLVQAAEYGRGIRVFRQDLWEMIISFIISQQKRIPDIRRCIEALCTRFGQRNNVIRTEETEKEDIEWYAFPMADVIAAAGPGGLTGLSLGYRERYIYETALKYLHDECIQSGSIQDMSYEEARAHLKTYPGVGEKVANCICLFGLAHKDAFPIDVHIKDILCREYYHGDEPREKLTDKSYEKLVEKHFARYRGYRGIVQQWIFSYEIKSKYN